MSALSRTGRWRLAVVGAVAGMVLAVVPRGFASDGDAFTYTVTAPGTGYSLVAGSTVVITWTSTGSSNVNISLVDVNAWAVVDIVATNTADDGSESYAIPANLPTGQYLIYIENVGVTDWAFGETFDILACGAQRMQQQAPRRERLDRSRPMPPLPRAQDGTRSAPKTP